MEDRATTAKVKNFLQKGRPDSEGEGNCPLHCHGGLPGGVLRLMPSTSTRDACLTSWGLPWADLGRPESPDQILRHRRLRMVCLRLYSLLGIASYADLREWARELRA